MIIKSRINNPRSFRSSTSGSALLLTLLVVSLLLVLVLGFVMFVRLELREVLNRQQLFQARSNARLGMELALSGLQDHAGADKRVSGTAALAGYTDQPHWTGIWQSDLADPTWTGAAGGPVWLVSGSGTPEPDMSLPDDTSVGMVPDTLGSTEVRVPLEEMAGQVGTGWFGWWVGDEGVKARVDIQTSEPVTGGQRERMLRSQSPSEPDMRSLGGAWGEEPAASVYARDGSGTRNRLISRDSVAMEVSNIPIETIFHDLTVHGYGLPVNVKDGGLKADWSVILDSSMELPENISLVDHYMGARPTQSPTLPEDQFRPPDYRADIYAFPESQIYNPDRFFLSERIGSDVSVAERRPGPNLGILWHYGRLWREVSNQSSPLVGLHPKVESDLRREDWLPYDSANRSEANSDQQHTNSGVAPVISHMRFGIRLAAEEIPEVIDPDTGDVITESTYEVQLELKPLIGLWNPYSVGIQEDNYIFEWFLSPLVKIRVTKDGDSEEYTSWVRGLWSGRTGSERWMQLRTWNTDFEPGEVRLFSVDQAHDQTGTDRISNTSLTSNWSSDGYIRVDFRIGANLQDPLIVPAGSTIEVLDVYLQDTHHPDTQNEFNFDADSSMTWITFKARQFLPDNGLYLSRYTGLWNGGRADEAPGSGDFIIPEPLDEAASVLPSYPVQNLSEGSEHLATWAFHLRTTEDIVIANQRTRGWIDTDPRAPVFASFWDGERSFDSDPPDGWYYTAPFTGEGIQNRGLAPLEEPQATGDRYNGYLGTSITSTNDGVTHVPLFDVPTAPLVSVGQFQHAQLGRYGFEPAFVAGNSYANVRIPLDETVSENHNGIPGFDLYDISYDVNERMWDRMFFSTLAPDYVGGGTSWEAAFSDRLDRLPNPRMVYVPTQEETSLDALLAINDNNGRRRGAEALSSRIRVLGAFNVNSTSKTAWKAVLSSMVTSELPVVDPATGLLSWESPDGIRFNRFGHVLSEQPYEAGAPNTADFWQGWRKLSEQELDDLAAAMVEEVRARGPFRSMADFVNRDPDASDIEYRRKGALQAALDRTVNAVGTGISDSVGDVAMVPSGARYAAQAFDGESTAAGHAAYLLQGDVLQSLAPILSARSDTFTVRAYGALGDAGNPTAKAWCEAVVQRVAGYVEDTDEPWRNPVDDTLNPLNARFGRHFEIVSFRWLNASEVESTP
ncbi:MAG: hypothetical protein PF795_04105 [Kiritimatiellae bacterium]|jgi:hypothetical protein|nr:hypothetical protein [Kiritimatiellia bacterium]